MKDQKSHKFLPALFTTGSINAIIFTGILSFLMRPLVISGTHVPDMGFLVWIYLVPLLIGMHRHKLWHKMILAFLSSLIGNYVTFYWLITAMQKFGELSFFESFAALTLMCFLLGILFSFFIALASWTNHMIKLPLSLILPLFLTTHDILLHHFPFNGFPWGIPPYALGNWLQYFQWIDHTGVFGLSFLIYTINGLLAGAVLVYKYRKQVDKMIMRFAVIFVLVLFSLFMSSFSNQAYEKNKKTKTTLNIALIQGNIPQDQKWDTFFAQDILNDYFELTHKAIKDGANLIIWPETAYPFGLRYPKLTEETFLNKERLSTPMLVGAFVSEADNNSLKIYNSVIHINQDAKMVGVYRKMHLVPFGEYLPFQKYLGFIPTITRAVGELSAGTEVTLFDVDSLLAGSLICFEDIFPKYARAVSQKQADILVNYTNDAWYGDSSAQHQHLVFSQFRALENRSYLFRATNTGMTAIINPSGEVYDRIKPFASSYLMHNIKVDVYQSFYTKQGDTWTLFVLVCSILIMIYTIIKRSLGPVKIIF